MPGPNKQPDAPGSRINRVQGPEMAVLPKIKAPAPPADMLPATLKWWDEFWKSDVARAVQADTDIRGVERLAWLYDERARMATALREQETPVTLGSSGQLAMHPLTRYIGQLDAEIRQLEDRFGLNPKARINLGLDLAKARRSLDDLYGQERDQAGGDGEDDGGAPALELVDGSDLA